LIRGAYHDCDPRSLDDSIRHQQAIADKLGINLTDFKVLGLLHRRGEMTPKALTEATGLSAAAMTTVIDRLEQAGYVERRRGGIDRRSFTVHASKGERTKSRVSL
jgi:DNA-binding MarR family transcriptional regulator